MTNSDLWHYRPEARLIADQNGLPVARDVGPDDARVILSMQRGLLRIASPIQDTGTDRAGAFIECAAVARSSLDGNETLDPADVAKREPGDNVQDVLERLLAYEADAFETGAAVDFQDVTAFFAKARADLVAAMHRGRVPLDFSLATATRDLVSAMEEAMEQHIYDASNGEEPDEDSGYVRAINAGKAALAGLNPVRIAVHVDGGIVSEVYGDRPLAGLEVTVIDYDHNGSDDNAMHVTCERGGIEEANVAVYDMADMANVGDFPLIQELADDEDEDEED